MSDGQLSGGDSGVPPAGLERRADGGGRRGALLAWLAILLLVPTLYLLQTEKAAERAAPGGGVAQPNALLTAAAKAVVGEENPQGRASAADMLVNFRQSPADGLRQAVLVAEVRGREEGLKFLQDQGKSWEGNPKLVEDAALLARLYKGELPQGLTEAEVTALRERHGWFADLAGVFGLPDTSPKRAELLAGARRSFAVLLLANLGVLGIGVVSFGLFVTAIVLLATGRLKRAFKAPAPGGSVYIETLAVFLLGYLLLNVVLVILQPPAPVAMAGQWCLAATIFWPLLRGVRWADWRRHAGWHSGRGVVIEMGAGVLGYLACLPVVVAGLVVTLICAWLSKLMGSDASPMHPAGDAVAKGTFWQVVAMMALATIWAPVVEETLFRGSFYRHLRGRVGMVLAGMVSGFVFAAIHPQGWIGIPVLMSVGFCFAMLREWRGTLLAPMAAHAANNATVLTVVLLLTGA